MSLLLLVLTLNAAPADFAPVWAAAGLSRAEARVDLEVMELYGGGEYRLPLFGYLMADPQRIPELSALQLTAFAGSQNVADALGKAAWLMSRGVRRNLVDDPVAAYRERVNTVKPLEDAIARVRTTAHATPGTIFADPPTADLPTALQSELALLLLTIEQCARWRDEAFAAAPAAGMTAHVRDLIRYATLDRLLPESGSEQEHQQRLDRLMAAVDDATLQAAGMDLALTLDAVRAALAKVPADSVTTRAWDTPWGPIVLGGPGPDQHDGRQPLVIVDLGGDDRYSVGAAADETHPMGVILDLAGNDQYLASPNEPATWGGAVCGLAFLIDESGNDVYEGTDATQGCGIAGVGVLWDGGGTDRYTARTHAQGAGAYGTGLLVDLGGDDTYTVFQRGQGYGFCRGAGVLCDFAGDDQYLADDTTIDFPSAQSKEHNASLAQGFGFGRRADYTDGHSLAGGVGLLADVAGNDHYTCGVFGQGSAYWYGTGLLADGAGDDAYHGVWYVQAATAHYAVSGLLDLDGADRYTATMNMAQGAGHDFSVSYLRDEAGNDHYTAPNLSLGAGNANGVGYFCELSGDDVYEADPNRINFGRARIPGTAEQLRTSLRRTTRCLGFFLDAAGNDQYPARDGLGNGLTWHDQEDGKAAYGAGVDR